MPIYRIADLNIKITPETKFSINRLAPYMVDADKYDFQVTVSQQDIDYELSVAQEGGEISAEFIAVFRQICTAVLQSYNGMFIHSAAIKYKKGIPVYRTQWNGKNNAYKIVEKFAEG